MSAGETLTRRYSIRDNEAFDRDRAELAEDGWEVARIANRDESQGFWWSLVASLGLLGRSSNELFVTYRKRDPDPQAERGPDDPASGSSAS